MASALGSFFHSLYNRTVVSNIALAGVPFARDTAHHDLSIVFEPFARKSGTPLHSAFPTAPNREPLFILYAIGDDYLFDFPDEVQYVVSADGTKLAASWPSSLDAEIAATYFVSVVMAFVLRLGGHEVLHASAVLIDDAAIAFIGPSGAGKSTLAACFAMRGFRVISDDVSALIDRGDRFDILSSHTRLRLWSDSAALFPQPLPFIAGDEWKRYLDLMEGRQAFAEGTFELRAIYSFEDRVDDDSAPRVEPLAGREALVDLLANTFKYPPRGPDVTSSDFERLGRVARHVPMRLIVPHRDLARCWAMADLVAADARQIVCAASVQ